MLVSTFDSAATLNPQPQRSTLLIVDDEEGPRQSLRVVFKEEYNLLLASDGPRALELARHNKINAAVMDIRMKGMSGIEVLEKLKALHPTIEVIMLTAYETIDTVRQALRLGACDYLNKPFDVASIRKAVSTAMERHSLADAMRANNEKLAALQSELQNHKWKEEVARTRGEIYASIIHDINGPLTIISGFISLIDQHISDSQQVEGEDLETIKEQLKSITCQVGKCIEISRRYLGFLRQCSDFPSQVQVNMVLQDLRQLLESHPSKGQHQLQIQSLPEDVPVKINGTDLIQILLNLSINALQCSSTPITIQVQARLLNGPLDFSSTPDGPNDQIINRDVLKEARVLELSVSDNGPGIAPEMISKVFEPYFTTKPVGKGTGLGLSIVNRLVKEAKSTVHLHSKVGEGTSFRLYLPR